MKGMSGNSIQKVILVDEHDRQIGIEDKLKAHQNGAKLHRAFSVFVFNNRGETMLQKRALSKYHTPGKWTNACCSHPYPEEDVLDAAHRRLMEEMGFDCEMEEKFSFIYKADVGNGLTEHEYDHVMFGSYDGAPKLNRDEAIDYKWISLNELREDLEANPEAYTPWLRIAIDRVVDGYNGSKI